MRRQLLLASTMLLGLSLIGNDADVLRYQYKRTTVRSKQAPAAPAARPALRTQLKPARTPARTASIRLEPR